MSGISIRFIRSYVPNENTTQTDTALMLVAKDDRDLPFHEKLSDALTFMAFRRRSLQ